MPPTEHGNGSAGRRLQKAQIGIGELASRLASDVPEIRRRALRALLLKLSSGLLATADLVHETSCIRALMDWFNKEGFADSEGVVDNSVALLELLADLAKHPYAQSTIVELGGVGFMRDLRVDTPDHVRQHVDRVLENLLHVPTRRATSADSVLRTVQPPEATSMNIRRIGGSHPARPFTPTKPPYSRQASPIKRRRSRSPMKVAPSYPPPPRLPNTVVVFDFVHLGPVDVDFVNEFSALACLLYGDADMDAEILDGKILSADRLFDMLAVDIGPQIFLQHSELFEGIMSGLDSRNEKIQLTFLSYLGRLASLWIESMRSDLDATRLPTNSASFNNTPNVSTHGAAAELSQQAAPAAAISLTFAAHEIYVRLVPALQTRVPIVPALEIIYEMLPLLFVHVESIVLHVTSIWHSCDDLDERRSQFAVQTVLYYVSLATSVFLYAKNITEISSRSEGKDRISRSRELSDTNEIANLAFTLALDVACTLAPADKDEIHAKPFMSAVEYLLALTYPHHLPSAITLSILSPPLVNPEPDVPHILIWLMTHASDWVREEVYTTLLSDVMERTAKNNIEGHAMFEDAEVLHVLIVYGLRDTSKKAAKAAYRLILGFAKSWPLSGVLRSFLPVIQCYYALDGGDLLNSVLDRCGVSLSSHERLCLHARGLFHKDDSYRRQSAQGLAEFTDSFSTVTHSRSSSVTSSATSMSTETSGKSKPPLIEGKRQKPLIYEFELADALVFPPSFLSATAVEDDISVASIAGLKERDLDRFVNALKAEAVDSQARRSALKQLEILIRERPLRNRAVQLGLLPMLTQQLKSAGTGGAEDDIGLLSCLKILRHLIENSPHVCESVQADQAFVHCLLRFLYHPNVSHRYELSRILFPILFDTSLFRTKEMFHFVSLASSGDKFSTTPRFGIPSFLADSFQIHAPVHAYSCGYPTQPVCQPHLIRLIAICLKNHRRGGIDMNPKEDEHVFAAKILSRVTHAQNVEDFNASWSHLEAVCASQDDLRSLASSDFTVFGDRYLNLCPAGAEDAALLQRILALLCRLLRSTSVDPEVRSTFLKSAKVNLLPWLSASLKQQQQDVGATGNTSAARLSIAIINLLRTLFQQLSEEELMNLARTTDCIEVLKAYTHACFAAQNPDCQPCLVRTHTLRVSCLECLLSFAGRGSLSSAVREETITDLIRMLVIILGYTQQNYQNATHGNSFTHKDRAVYRTVALCLRDLSRSTLSLPESTFWGDHWLFEGDIRWLTTLLADDEKHMQKLGLGIMSNLIMVKASYQLLSRSLPRIIDMAFSYVLDLDCHPMLRKESILVINNFLVAFWADNATAAAADLGKSGDSDNVQSDVTRDTGCIGELLHIFDTCSFIESIPYLLDSDHSAVAYRCAMLELCLNIGFVLPDQLFAQLSQDSWSVLLSYLTPPKTAFVRGADDSFPLRLRSIDEFRNNQFHSAYMTDISRMQSNALRILRLALDQKSHREALIRSSNLLPTLMDTFSESVNDLASPATRTGPWPSTAVMNPAEIRILGLAASLIGDCLWDICASNPTQLQEVFACHNMTAHLWLISLLIGQTDSAETHRAACCLAAKLLALQFGMEIELGLEEAVTRGQYVGEAGTPHPVGRLLTKVLVGAFFHGRLTEDREYDGAVRNALQSLFGCCEAAKCFALDSGLIQQLVTHVTELLCRFSGKLDNDTLFTLLGALSLLRHLFAGSIGAKLAGTECGMHRMLHKLLTIRDLAEPVLLEALAVIRNFAVNCATAKRLIVEPQRARAQRGGQPVLVLVVQILRRSLPSHALFAGCMEVLKVVVLADETRALFVKLSILSDISTILGCVLKSHDVDKQELVLQFLFNLTLKCDSQAHSARIQEGLVQQLVNMLGVNHSQIRCLALLVLRNIAFHRENKSCILLDENFLPKMAVILAGRKIKVISAATALLWVLLFDSQKAKAALKKQNIGNELISLRKRLAKDKEEEDEQHHKDVQAATRATAPHPTVHADETKLLRQTLANVNTCLKLLNIH